jgi:hypothetical protein
MPDDASRTQIDTARVLEWAAEALSVFNSVALANNVDLKLSIENKSFVATTCLGASFRSESHDPRKADLEDTGLAPLFRRLGLCYHFEIPIDEFSRNHPESTHGSVRPLIALSVEDRAAIERARIWTATWLSRFILVGIAVLCYMILDCLFIHRTLRIPTTAASFGRTYPAGKSTRSRPVPCFRCLQLVCAPRQRRKAFVSGSQCAFCNYMLF